MAHDVFISYAVEDVQVAEKVCRALEEQSIKCWMAPRDVPFGADYEESIVDAISTTPLLVLILSQHSNASPHVKREIQNACAEGSPTQVIPLRIDAVPYSKALRYYLGSAQWLDASAPPLEAHLQRLVEYVRTRLRRGDAQEHESAGGLAGTEPPPAVTERVSDAAPPVLTGTGDGRTFQGTGDGRKKLPLAWVAGGAVLLAAAVAVVAYMAFGGGGNEKRQGGGEVASVSPTPAGNGTGGNTGAPTPDAGPTSQQTPPSTPPATPASSPAPTPASATPTPAASPRPPRNINFRLPVNAVVGAVNRVGVVEEVPDWQIKAQIEKRMASHDQLSNVKVEVAGGVVTLSGSVPDADWKSTAQMISKINGVKEVHNNLKHN